MKIKDYFCFGSMSMNIACSQVTFKSILFSITIFLISLFNILLFANASNVLSSLTSDNLAIVVDYDRGVFSNLVPYTYHGGGYTTAFLTKIFVSGLSEFFSIHIHDFIGYPLGLIKGIIFSFVLFALSRAALVFNKSKLLFCCSYLYFSVSSFLFILQGSEEALGLIADNTYFFRFILPMFFYFLFLYFLSLKILLKNYIKNNFYIFSLAFFSCLFICTNCEVIIVQILLLLFFLFLFNFFCKTLKKVHVSFYLSLFFKFSYLCCLFFSLLYINSPAVKDLLSVRVDNSSVVNILTNIYTFFYDWLVYCFFYFGLYHILFLFCISFAFYISYRRKELRKILFALIFYLSLILSMYSLSIVQKEEIHYISDFRILYVYNLMLLYALFFVISYILKYTKFKKYLLTLFSFFIFSLSFSFILKIPASYNNNVIILNKYNWQRKVHYIQEKIYRFYNIKKEIPYLDKVNLYNTTEDCLLWTPSQHLNNGIDICIPAESSYIYNYYVNIYGVEPLSEICFSENAIASFYEHGGTFYKEEFDNVLFSRLYDEKYLLSIKSSEKILPDDVINFLALDAYN